jgi:hypothetical protein
MTTSSACRANGRHLVHVLVSPGERGQKRRTESAASPASASPRIPQDGRYEPSGAFPERVTEQAGTVNQSQRPAAEYEAYRTNLASDADALANIADVSAAKAILVESRSFLRRA